MVIRIKKAARKTLTIEDLKPGQLFVFDLPGNEDVCLRTVDGFANLTRAWLTPSEIVNWKARVIPCKQIAPLKVEVDR